MRPLARMLVALAVGAAAPAHAHKPSDSYLRLSVDEARLDLRWDLSLRDLDLDLALDADADGKLTWGEVKAARPRIEALALGALTVTSGGSRCALVSDDLRVTEHSDGAYAVLLISGRCAATPEALELDYRLLFDRDPQHRGLLALASGGRVETAIFRPGAERQTFSLRHTSALAELATFVREGVWHVWIGLDHVLFLLALLLPAVLLREGRGWTAAPALRPAIIDVVKVVTAFTVAHSITLSLASLSLVSLPSRWVEAGIALSVVVAAVNNLFPIVPFHRWVVAFALGLLHGFGFSSVLVDLGLPEGHLAAALFGFNVGVELGQLSIVAVFVPAAFALRASWFYQRVVVLGGSATIALLAMLWSVERAFELTFI